MGGVCSACGGGSPATKRRREHFTPASAEREHRARVSRSGTFSNLETLPISHAADNSGDAKPVAQVQPTPGRLGRTPWSLPLGGESPLSLAHEVDPSHPDSLICSSTTASQSVAEGAETHATSAQTQPLSPGALDTTWPEISQPTLGAAGRSMSELDTEDTEDEFTPAARDVGCRGRYHQRQLSLTQQQLPQPQRPLDLDGAEHRETAGVPRHNGRTSGSSSVVSHSAASAAPPTAMPPTSPMASRCQPPSAPVSGAETSYGLHLDAVHHHDLSSTTPLETAQAPSPTEEGVAAAAATTAAATAPPNGPVVPEDEAKKVTVPNNAQQRRSAPSPPVAGRASSFILQPTGSFGGRTGEPARRIRSADTKTQQPDPKGRSTAFAGGTIKVVSDGEAKLVPHALSFEHARDGRGPDETGPPGDGGHHVDHSHSGRGPHHRSSASSSSNSRSPSCNSNPMPGHVAVEGQYLHTRRLSAARRVEIGQDGIAAPDGQADVSPPTWAIACSSETCTPQSVNSKPRMGSWCPAADLLAPPVSLSPSSSRHGDNDEDGTNRWPLSQTAPSQGKRLSPRRDNRVGRRERGFLVDDDGEAGSRELAETVPCLAADHPGKVAPLAGGSCAASRRIDDFSVTVSSTTCDTLTMTGTLR